MSADPNNYAEMLERAYIQLPEILKEKPRFTIPEIKSVIQGKTTIIQNLGEIAKELNRDHETLAKYFLAELGTSGYYDAQRVILKGMFRAEIIKEKFNAFVKEYVLCRECNRPDTAVVHDKEKRIDFLKCEACGARYTLKEMKFKKA